jgi:hypothetical protein
MTIAPADILCSLSIYPPIFGLPLGAAFSPQVAGCDMFRNRTITQQSALLLH